MIILIYRGDTIWPKNIVDYEKLIVIHWPKMLLCIALNQLRTSPVLFRLFSKPGNRGKWTGGYRLTIINLAVVQDRNWHRLCM